MDDDEQIEISCIGVSYLQPIFDLMCKAVLCERFLYC